MKKVLSIIIITIVTIILAIYVYGKNEPVELSQTEGITTVLTLEDEIQNDAIWCGTFQLIWNDLKNDLAKQDIVFTPQLTVVENLNKETFTIDNISDKYYYKKVGTPSIALKEEIEKAIKDKFNETSDILNDFEWEARDPKDYFLYAMLKKEFKFEKAIQTIEFELDREGGKIKSEAGIMANLESAIILPEEIREFFIDDTFAIFLIEEGKDTPYFGGKIDDITKFQ